MRESKAREYLRTIYALELSGPVRGVDTAHEPLRREKQKNGLSPDEAERQAVRETM